MAYKHNPVTTFLAIAGAKMTRWLLHKLHRGGTALPGRVAMFFDKNLLDKVSEGMEVIVVTGTNGKTTTCNMIETAMSEAGKDTIANKAGSNMLLGITLEFADNATLSGKPKKHYAVMECDEGALKQVTPLCNPKVIVVTNLFRDQLDRYGTVKNVRDQIRTGVELSPESVVCLNADCSNVASIGKDLANKVLYYGLDVPVGDQENVDVSDAPDCIIGGTPYEYKYHTYAHLGGFSCPNCGYARPAAQVAVKNIVKAEATGTTVNVEFSAAGEPKTQEVRIGLPAVFNVYNAAATLCAFEGAGFDRAEAIASRAQVQSAFGRMETYDLDGVPMQMILVKNPASMDQAMGYVVGLEQDYNLVMGLNNHISDGTDVSWLWDAHFKVCEDPHLGKVIVSGECAEDLKKRLMDGGLSEDRIQHIPDDATIIEKCRASKLPVFILPNYTYMMTLRESLGAVTGNASLWEV